MSQGLPLKTQVFEKSVEDIRVQLSIHSFIYSIVHVAMEKYVFNSNSFYGEACDVGEMRL